ncbi:MAG: esterase-like activity of phytase family protein, partial [Rhizobiaceae bacterium]
KASEKKWLTDAEGLLVDGGKVSVSFERDHRISTGTLDDSSFAFAFVNERLPVPAREIRSNRGFETLAKSPDSSVLAGARVAVTEKSLNKDRNIFAGIMDGPGKGVFFVARQGDYDITDGDFLPNGDLLLLERKFSMAAGVAMRIRQIAGDTIKKGATVDGPILLEADMAYQIDNMEGLDVWQRADGATMVSLMSDDNHSILQRNLYLEFELGE